MNNAPENLSKGNLKDRFLRAGSYLGAMLASTVMIGDAPAMASRANSIHQGSTPVRIEASAAKPGFIPYPPELNSRDVLTPGKFDLIQKDAQQALSHKKVQLKGVMIIHQPSQNADIGFTDSPRAYSSFSDPNWIFSGPDKNYAHDKTKQLVVSDPYLLQSKVGGHNRLFAMVYTAAGQPAFLDLKFAEEVQGVTFEAYDGSKLGTMPIGESTKSPNVDYEETGRNLENSKADAAFIDSHKKVRHARLTDAVPHM